mmetsp:Transcript_86765/g.190458  ORF Transcript_86765/g.190458 Transcript_86765/m.190458 type:complete len:267 (-) Transcript_86765:336-1136(-)
MTLPEALDAEIVQTVVTRKGCRIVLALLALLLRLDDITIGNVDEHGLVAGSLASSVHVFKTLEAEVVRAIGAEDLWLLHSARGTETSTSCGQKRVILPRPLGILVESICTSLAEGHHALVALQGRLHHTAGLARNLQIPEFLVEEHVGLLEKKSVDRRLGTEAEQVQSLSLQDLQVPLRQWMLDGVVIVDSVVKVAYTGTTHLHLCVWRHRSRQHLARDPRELGLEGEVDAEVGDKLHGRELGLASWNLQGSAGLGLFQKLLGCFI